VPDPQISGPSRWRLAVALVALPLLTGAVLRVALAVAYLHDAASLLGVLFALVLGSVLDAAVSLIALTPVLVLVICARESFFDGPWARRLLLAVWVFGLGFLATAEWFFWDEFTSRFNHIALDYLIYPHEVFVNIWESYHVPAVVGSLGAEFVGGLGSSNACTPQLDRWSQQGLLLTNLIANGNRTVRGLEGVLCSFLPVPPDSVVKRDRSNDLSRSLSEIGARG
jgi:hypothetical protein